jgi:hypothetical protein
MNQRRVGFQVAAFVAAMFLLAGVFAFLSGTTQASAPVGVHAAAPVAGAARPYVAAWVDIAPFPTVTISPTPGNTPLKLKRAGAAAYPPNGKLYVLGGRHGIDGEDTTLEWIWEYTPGSPGSWVRKSALLDVASVGERSTANMAVVTLTDTTGVRVYAIGGSDINSQPTPIVRVYNPIADSVTVLPAADNWPASPARIPGGYAVVNNKLFIFGGFSRLANGGTGGVFADTWRFDPMAPSGSKWSQITTANLQLGRAYIAGAALDGMIYAIGGDTWDWPSFSLIPVANVERLDPTLPNPTWTGKAALPTARGDAGAWAYDTGTGYQTSGRIVLAGGVYPVPDNAAYLYDPLANTWGSFAALLHPTRNFGAAALNGLLYAFGGYDYSNNTPSGANFSQGYDASVPQPTSTPTSTRTPALTNTPTSTRTPTRAPTSTSTGTPTAGALLVGHVTWQGRPAQPSVLQQLPVTLTLKLGTTEVDYPAQNTDASGFFTVPVGSLAGGQYAWRVKSAQAGAGQSDYNPGFLSTSGSVTLAGAPVTNVDMGLQQSGDCNNDDRVTVVDFSILKLSFGQQPGQPNWDRRADIDGSDTITVVDFAQLKSNFGHSGSPPIRPSEAITPGSAPF